VYGAIVLALMAVIFRVATNLQFLQLHFMDWRTPLWIRRTACLTAGGSLSIAVILLATWLTRRRSGAPALGVLAVLLVTVCIGQSPDVWRRWSSQRFPPASIAILAPWRELLPANAEIFWSEEPLSAWVLLEHPSYISVSQSSGVMFSRVSAMELLHRAQALSNVVPVRSYLDFDVAQGAGLGPSPQQLAQVCAADPLQFLVTSARLPWQPIAELPSSEWHLLGRLRLYRCSDRVG
jgi:hypothetical protein